MNLTSNQFMESSAMQSGVSGNISILAPGILVLAIISIVVASIIQSKMRRDISTDNSYFDGNFWSWLGWRLLSGMFTCVTLGIAYPWAKCMLLRWEVGHRVVNGKRMRFIGSGGQLFGKYILWALLTIVTCGIFGFWMGLRMKKWVVKHTVFESDPAPLRSRFTGGIGGWFGIRFLAFLMSVCTLGIGAPWAKRMIIAWEMNHTYISGHRLGFAGKGGQLFGKSILWGFLTIVTITIYSWFIPVRFRKWIWSHAGATPCELPDEKKAPFWVTLLIVLGVLVVLAGIVLAVIYFLPELRPMLQNISIG